MHKWYSTMAVLSMVLLNAVGLFLSRNQETVRKDNLLMVVRSPGAGSTGKLEL